MIDTWSRRAAIALIFACGCEAATLSAPPAVVPKPAVARIRVAVTASPQLVGADPHPEPALLAPSHALVIGIAVGAYHACAVHEDGAVSCWGSSSHGQLGVADPDQSAVPIGVAVSDVVEISAESDATCARQRSGRIVCRGALQNSGVDEPPTPTKVSDAAQLSGVCVVASGETTCVRHRDGTLACFGELPQSSPPPPKPSRRDQRRQTPCVRPARRRRCGVLGLRSSRTNWYVHAGIGEVRARRRVLVVRCFRCLRLLICTAPTSTSGWSRSRSRSGR